MVMVKQWYQSKQMIAAIIFVAGYLLQRFGLEVAADDLRVVIESAINFVAAALFLWGQFSAKRGPVAIPKLRPADMVSVRQADRLPSKVKSKNSDMGNS